MTTSTARRAVVGATWLTLGGYLSFLLNFAVSLLLVRLLFPEDFGTFALVSAVVELLSLLAGLAFSQGIIQMPEEPGIEDTAYRLTVWLCLALLGVGGVAGAVAWMVRGGRFGLLVLVVFGARLMTTLSYVYSAQLEREFRYRSLSVIRLLSAVAGLAVVLVLAAKGAGVWSLVGREVALITVTYVGIRAATPWRYGGGYDARTARRLFAFATRIFATRALEVINFRADALLLGLLVGTVALGFYDRARFLAELGHYAVSFAAVQVAFPLYARFKNDPARLAAAYRIIHYFLIRLMLPVALVMTLLPRELVIVLFGSRWDQAVPALRWLAGYAFLLPILDNTKVLLTGMGHLGDAMRIRLVQVLTVIPALIALIPRWGAPGAAGAMTLGSITGAITAFSALRRHQSDLILRIHAAPLASAVLAAAALLLSQRTWLAGWAPRPGSAAALVLIGAVYTGGLVVLEYGELSRHLQILRPLRSIREDLAQ